MAPFQFLKRWCLALVILGTVIIATSQINAAVAEEGNIENVKDEVQKENENIVKHKEPNVDLEDGGADGGVIRRDAVVSLGFFHAFVASLSVIIVSELGDKTFFIAAIMAMRHARITVFSAALLALAVMTILSALLGFATTIIPRWFTYYASTFLFAIFGLRMLRDGWNMSPDEGQEELEEVQAELKKRDEQFPLALLMCHCSLADRLKPSPPTSTCNGIDRKHEDFELPTEKENNILENSEIVMEKETLDTVTHDPESGVIRGGKPKKVLGIFSPIFIQAFILTFLAEWGDRSQITTIILAARENVFGVTIGGILGHALCTGLAVIGGRLIAQRISVRTVTLVGGVVFLVFALSALFFNSEEQIT